MLPCCSSSGDSSRRIAERGGRFLAWEERRRCLIGDFDGRDPVDAFRASSLLMEVSGGEADLERDGNICTSDAILRGSADGSGLRQSRATAVRDSGKKVGDCKNSMTGCKCRQRGFFVARTLEAAIATRREQLEAAAAEISVAAGK